MREFYSCKSVEEECVRMSVRWETEGLQTVGIVCLVLMFLKLMHLLGLIDITETGERGRKRERERTKHRKCQFRETPSIFDMLKDGILCFLSFI